MGKPQVGVILPAEDLAFLDTLADKNMSYRSTIARRLLMERIAEMRSAVAETQKVTGEESP